MAERAVVVRKTRVRFPLSTLFRKKRMKNTLAIARKLNCSEPEQVQGSPLKIVNTITKLNAENPDSVGFGANK